MHKYTKSRLVCGVGINDADYPVNPRGKGKRYTCKFYRAWVCMITRCYNDKFHQRCKTYESCSVHKDWLVFSNFKAWMQSQDYEGKQLDKDILITGSKLYSPDTCAFVDGALNKFVTDCMAGRGQWPLGVSFDKGRGKFIAKCNDPISKKSAFAGYFDCPIEAGIAWKKKKHEMSCKLADLQSDQRVAEALRTRYL